MCECAAGCLHNCSRFRTAPIIRTPLFWLPILEPLDPCECVRAPSPLTLILLDVMVCETARQPISLWQPKTWTWGACWRTRANWIPTTTCNNHNNNNTWKQTHTHRKNISQRRRVVVLADPLPSSGSLPVGESNGTVLFSSRERAVARVIPSKKKNRTKMREEQK